MNLHDVSSPIPYATPYFTPDFNNPLQVVGDEAWHKVYPSPSGRKSPHATRPKNAELSRAEEEVARSAVAKIFFKGRSLVEHQLRSFNEFMEYGLPAMFDEAAPLEISPDPTPVAIRIGARTPKVARISYGEVSVGKPYCSVMTRDGTKGVDVVDLLPNEARLRNMSYSAHLYVNMTLEVITSTRTHTRACRRVSELPYPQANLDGDLLE